MGSDMNAKRFFSLRLQNDTKRLQNDTKRFQNDAKGEQS